MRCRCCDSPEAKWDGVDFYCDSCLDSIWEAIHEDEEDDEDELLEE